ncbi:MAG: WecB/TagA/CpsF family glycosyltransferase [Phycisphaerae bacterium]|jgi:N-acetylglucosaminyldiphosphoundecaprenol N-acetyl-beta-D-mannosaminyltransferase
MIQTEQSTRPETADRATRRINLLDLPFDVVTFDQAVQKLIELAKGDKPAYATTANVDHVVRVHRRPELRPLYAAADLVVADGTPLIWASRILRTPLPERVAGSDLFPTLCAKAAEHDLSVFFLGGAPGTAQRAAETLQARHAALRVVGTHCPPFGFENDEQECAQIVERIKRADPDILFVGLGSPKQERWIADHRTEYRARLSIGVGISFSFVCGDVKRAPRWMQRVGLEWFHRLVQEPGRLWKRYLIDDLALIPLVLRNLVKRRAS